MHDELPPEPTHPCARCFAPARMRDTLCVDYAAEFAADGEADAHADD